MVQTKAPNRYDSSSEDDGEPVKRVVKSQQDKVAQELETLLRGVRVHIKANEFTAFSGGMIT